MHPAVAMDGKPSLLVVEDDPDLRAMLLSALESLPLDLHEARTVAEALGQLCERRFSLVVTDLNLPDGNGIAVLERAREREGGTPVVLMTAFGGTAARALAKEAGAFAYLEKPFALDRLIDLVQTAIPIPIPIPVPIA